MKSTDRSALDGSATYPRPLSAEVHYTPAAVAGMSPRLRWVVEHLSGASFSDAFWSGLTCDADDGSPAAGELGDFMAMLRIRHFSVGEVVKPRHPAIARQLGYQLFVPPRFLWPTLAVVLMLAEHCRRTVGEPVKLNNAWRPYSYNERVSDSTLRSDHPNGCGVDLAFATSTSRAKAEGFVRGLHAVMDLRLRLGLGYRVLHVGTFAPHGTEEWTYKGYGDEIVSPTVLPGVGRSAGASGGMMSQTVQILRSTIEALVAGARAAFVENYTQANGNAPAAALVDDTIGPFFEPVATQAICAWAGLVWAAYEHSDWDEIDALIAWKRDYYAALVDAGTVDPQRDVAGAFELVGRGQEIIEQRERGAMSGQLSDDELRELVGKG